VSRFQKGYIYFASGAFHVRYNNLELVDGQEVRRQRSHRLCTKDAKYTSVSCKAVRLLAEDFLRSVNSQIAGTVKADVRVNDFFDGVYMSFIRADKRSSTVSQYTNLFNGTLRSHFGTRTLSEYQTSDGFKFLQALKGKLNRNSLAHVRSLASGIFSHAANLGLIQTNPWREVRVKTPASEPTVAYTLAESLAIIAVLKASPKKDAALIFALSAFLGLRPSESGGLRWENTADDCIFIRGSVVYGIAGDTKTEQSKRQLPLIEPVKSLMFDWRTACANPTEGWLFPNPSGGCRHMDAYAKNHLLTAVRGAGLAWHGLYAARRGAATSIMSLTANPQDAAAVLGHSLAVVMKHYIKTGQNAGGVASMRLLELAAKNGDK
jgi:integrase